MKKTSAKFRNLKQCLCWACCSAGLKSESSSSHDLSGWLSSLTTLQSVPGQLGAGLPKHSLPRDSSSSPPGPFLPSGLLGVTQRAAQQLFRREQTCARTHVLRVETVLALLPQHLMDHNKSQGLPSFKETLPLQSHTAKRMDMQRSPGLWSF